MFAETLEDARSANPQMQSKYLRTIVNESERLSRLVDNVLDFARIEQDRKIYQMQRVSLADVVRSATQAIQYPVVRQNFELKIEIEENLPSLMADPDAVEQAILNLLANAMKYSGSSRQIDLQLRRENREAVIDVTDHGLGIAEENQTRIFEKFYRVRSAETDRVPGAGLGLTLVMHAVRAHGGRLLVSSALGMGSTFSIRLPLCAEEPAGGPTSRNMREEANA
jgi:two-component system phosphate regulon sensor histidine kinase PhoR